MMDTRTFRGWCEYLDTPGRDLTLSEFMALMLVQTREYGRQTMLASHEQQQALEHLEGMVGAMDDLVGKMAPPGMYAGSATARAALAAERAKAPAATRNGDA